MFSFRTYNNRLPQHLSNKELHVLQNLFQNKKTIVQISDEGNFIVLVNRGSYTNSIQRFNLMTDCSSGYFIYVTNTDIKLCKDVRVPILESLTSIRYGESNT